MAPDRTTMPTKSAPRDAPMALPCVLYVGRRRGEFQATLSTAAQCASLHQAATVEAALASIAAGLTPDVILLATEWPGQFSEASIVPLRAAAPGAPIVVLVGAWCEGETRGGQHVPGASRWYALDAPIRLRADLTALRAGGRPSFALPPTASDEARCAQDAAGLTSESGSRGVLAICTFDTDAWEMLARLAKHGGWSPLRLSAPVGEEAGDWRLEGVTAAIFDGTDLRGTESAALAQLIRGVRPARVVVLLGFPRTETIEHAIRLGAAEVLRKPYAGADLARLLQAY